MKTAITVRPLTKRKSGVTLYERPKRIQAAIAAALQIPPGDLLERAAITDRNHAHYLPPECLLHLVRNAMRSGDTQTRDALTPALFSRCTAVIKAKFSGDIAQLVQAKFVDLLARQVDPEADALDFFEVNFHCGLLLRGYDAIRAQSKRSEVFKQLIDESDDGAAVDPDLSKATTEALVAIHSELGDPILRNELLKAVEKLPYDERMAVSLVYFHGYKEESENPATKTAATLCKVSGRTIRNRLKSALQKLKVAIS